MFTFFTRHIFDDDNAVFIINYMGCERLNSDFAFTIHTHSYCPFLVFKSVESKGELIKSVPTTEKIEDEEFDFDFSWILATTESKATIKKLILNVSEIGEVYIGDFDSPSESVAQPEEKEEKQDVIEKPVEVEAEPQTVKKTEENQTQAKKHKAKM